MGQGSRNFAIYYGIQTLLFLIIMAIAFSLVASIASQCQEKCPLLIKGGPKNNFQACLCNSTRGMTNALGYVTSTQTELDRYQQIANATIAVNKHCYICQTNAIATVWEPCQTYEDCVVGGMLGFKPAASDISATNPQCNTQTGVVAPASILTSPTVTNRAYVLTLLYAIATFYLIQMLGALFCFLGFYTFKDKYGSDWSKLTSWESFLGICCKVAPIITRLANFGVVFFLIVAVVNVFRDGVCEYDTNEYNEIVFYPFTTGFVTFVAICWLLTCIFGVLFQKFCPRDTSFYNPEFPTNKNDACIKRCCCGFCHVLTTYGP
jgi:hypothetical protein